MFSTCKPEENRISYHEKRSANFARTKPANGAFSLYYNKNIELSKYYLRSAAMPVAAIRFITPPYKSYIATISYYSHPLFKKRHQLTVDLYKKLWNLIFSIN